MIKIMEICKQVAELSKDKTKVGAVAIAKDKTVLGVGFNGYPRGYNDSDNSYKYDKVIHAEVNAVINSRASRGEIEELYIYGLPPCKDCMKFLAAFGVKKVVFKVRTENEIWRHSYEEYKNLHPFMEFIEL